MVTKPKLPVIVYGLFALAVVGLIALGIAAFTAFSKVAGFWQALAASVLIEAAMVTEAVTIIRRNWWAAGGVLISLIVSGTYNYIQAEQAGRMNGVTDGWQLLTLAVGPLSALLFLALTIGHELSEHEKRVKAWETEQNRLAIERAAKEERKQNEQETRRAQLEYQKEKLRLETEAQIERAKAEEIRKAEVARVRIEAKTQRQITTNDAGMSRVGPTFARGYDGFVEYVHWVDSQGRTFDKTAAAQEMNRSIRQIERYIEQGRSNGVAEMLGAQDKNHNVTNHS